MSAAFRGEHATAHAPQGSGRRRLTTWKDGKVMSLRKCSSLTAYGMYVALSVTCGSLAFGQNAGQNSGQNAQGGQEPASVEEVVVTGTRIRTTDQGALPVQTITQEQILRSGAANPEQFLQTLSIAVQGNTNNVAATGSGSTTGGVSSVSLRGLGSQRTLVLLNGQRLAAGGIITDSNSVDVNGIPLAALEKVDVLKDSASAIYGSDAIAGVVNFIVRDNYQGAEVSAYGGGTTDGGGSITRANGIVGFGNLTADRFNVLFAASYAKEHPLDGWQRDFAASGVNVAAGNSATSGNTFPANFVAADGSFGTHNPLAGNCAPSISDPLIDPTGRCRYDPSPSVTLLPAAERYNVYTGAHFALSDNLQLYGTASYTQNRQEYVIQPVPLSDQFSIPANNPIAGQAPYSCGPGCATATILLAPGSPFYPASFVQSISGGPTPVLDIRYRSWLTGNRDWTDTSRQPRVTFGLKGSAGEWSYSGDFVYSQTQLTEHDNWGYPLYSKLMPLLNSGQVNFFGPNDPAITAAAQATNFIGDAYSTRATIAELGTTATGPVARLPAGPLELAVSASVRKEKFATDPSAEVQLDDIAGYGANFQTQDSQRNVYGAAVEAQVPILKTLNANAAARYDYYQGTGGKTTPKIGLRWKPVDAVLVRGSYGQGFRAPSLTDLHQPQGLGTTAAGISDPARCPTSGSSIDCNTQFNTLIGGNLQLQPETSHTFTLGFIVEPMRNLSLGVDGFSIKLTNTIISGVDPTTMLANPAVYGSRISRGAPTADCPGCPGPILSIDQTNLNFGETDVKGYDVDMRYRTDLTAAGKFSFSLVGSYFATYRIEQPDNSFLNVAGQVSPITNGNGGVIPRWHHYATVSWAKGSFELAASQNFQSSYADLPSSVSGAAREVASYSTLDLQAGYTASGHLKLALGARNALNKAPPYSNVGGQNYFQAGYDPGYADPRGRFVYGTMTYSLARQ
jgi:iron complex outermembrane receptor protein